MKNKISQPVPASILKEIMESEYKRTGIEEEKDYYKFSTYFEDYSTDSVGYHGSVVVVVWPASPGAISTFILENGQWKHCNSSAW